jgi:hypothetical protein
MMPRRERRVLRKKITQLPDILSDVEQLLNYQIGELAPGPTEAAMLEFSQLVYFRLLLERFGLGNHTLSAILQVMRAIRYNVQPIPPSARRLDPLILKNKDGSPHSSRVRDPLSAGAIDKTISRFFKEYGECGLREDVCNYLTPRYDSHRDRGETLLSLLPLTRLSWPIVPSPSRPAKI